MALIAGLVLLLGLGVVSDVMSEGPSSTPITINDAPKPKTK